MDLQLQLVLVSFLSLSIFWGLSGLIVKLHKRIKDLETYTGYYKEENKDAVRGA